MSIAYFDGNYVDKNQIKISPLDFGFSRGVALYEFARIYQGAPFRLDDHLDRLIHGAGELGIQAPVKADMAAIVAKLVTTHKYPQSTIKFYLTAGECSWKDGFGFNGCTDFTPHFMAIEDEAHPLHEEAPKGLELYRRGLDLKLVAFSRLMPTIKSTNYAPAFSALRQQGHAVDDVLFTHPDGYVTEGAMSNFFCVIDGKLCTPKRGMLFGITRKVLLELAPSCGIEAIERDILPAELANASEAFMTGSYAEMAPVRKIGEISLPTTIDGPVFSKMRRAFTGYIQRQTVARAA